MSDQYGVGQGHALDGALVQLATGDTYAATLNLQNVRIATNGAYEETLNKAGEINQLTVAGDYLECELEAVPQSTTKALAYAACKVPPRGTAFHLKDFGTVPIPFGPFTTSGICSANGSVVTNVGTDTMPWFLYSGNINATNSTKWTVSFTLRRYKQITSGTAIA